MGAVGRFADGYETAVGSAPNEAVKITIGFQRPGEIVDLLQHGGPGDAVGVHRRSSVSIVPVSEAPRNFRVGCWYFMALPWTFYVAYLLHCANMWNSAAQ